jgi:parvulin-like peptidyl-prolyl isomerase
MEMKTRLLTMSVLLALVAVLAACGGGGGSGSVPNDAVAKVGSETITKASFNSLMTVGFAKYKAQKQPKPKFGSAAYTQLQDQAVAFLVQQSELQQEADKLGVKVTQQDIDKQVATIRKTYYKNSQAKLLAELKKDDITLAQLEQYSLTPNLLTSKLNAKVTAKVKVTDAAAQKYYTQNKTSFTTPKTREVRHILVNSKSLAQRIEAQVKSGANFAKLAKKYSKDTGSAAQGGKLCVAHGGTSGACQQTVAPFDKAAFSLKTNEVALVHSVYGWHVLQPIGPVKPAHTQTFAEVKSQIEANLAQQQKQTVWQNWLTKMGDDFKGKVSYQTGYAPATTAAATTTG